MSGSMELDERGTADSSWAPPLRGARWPAEEGEEVVFLTESSSDIERRVLESWIERNRPEETDAASVTLIHLPGARLDEGGLLHGQLEARLGRDDDPLLAPLRVVWMPRQRAGSGVAPTDLLRFGNPRRPSRRRQAAIARKEPERLRVVVAESARRSELAERWQRVTDDEATDLLAFARFVGRQAVLALERAESRLRGPQYKVPRLVNEEISSSARFRRGIGQIAKELDREPDGVAAEATRYLDEMVTGFGRLLIDFTVHYGRWLQKTAYEGIDSDPDQGARVREAVAGKPMVVLSTHRSNFDGIVMPVVLHDNGLPRTHIVSGINMAIWPVGPIYRRLGTIFIRRDVRENPVYRFVLREYVGFLMEKRFALQWYLEGTRSRTGKMLPPKLGLLVYVVDAYREGRVDDVVLVPASFAYDQLQEVGDYAREARGTDKRPETFVWSLKFVGGDKWRGGKVYVRFGEPVTLRQALGPPEEVAKRDPDALSLDLQKLAFEISWRSNQVTPMTGSALVTLTLLGAHGTALTFDQVSHALRPWLRYATERDLPMASSARALEHPEGLRKALDLLDQNRVIRSFRGGPNAVFTIESDQHVAAAVYRNSVVHFFLNSAIAQIALVAVGAVAPDAPDAGQEPVDVFDAMALRLRDLLKFDFFFEEKADFRDAIHREMDRVDPHWRRALGRGSQGVDELMEAFDPLTAHTTLRPFFEAYGVVADYLERRGGAQPPEGKQLLRGLENLGVQSLLQQRLQNPESVSHLLFRTGLDLARNQRLLDEEAEPDELADRRRAFAAELDTILGHLGRVDALAIRRFAERMAQGEAAAAAEQSD